MFLNIIKLGAEFWDIKAKAKNSDINEKALEMKSPDEVKVEKAECQWTKETSAEEVETTEKVKNTKQPRVEVKDDIVKQSDDMKCDMCHYSCKKQNIIKKHMHTKHSGQQHSSDLKEKTSVKLMEQKKQRDKEENKGKDAGITEQNKCNRCDKMLTKEYNEKGITCQFCRMMTEYG